MRGIILFWNSGSYLVKNASKWEDGWNLHLGLWIRVLSEISSLERPKIYRALSGIA